MKSKLLVTLMMILTIVSLSGCVLNIGDHESKKNTDYWKVQQEKNRTNLTTLTMGMSKDQVLLIMGTADFTEAHLSQAPQTEQQEVEVYFYRTQWTKGDGRTTKDECTPVVLRNKVLVGWGESAYKSM
ncbi:DUF3192 domain-containing protein [Shewanella intestini]|uniref:DUF3192 domain-containing protein n=1 Tax=Shewanella intestini TaxID=2017544 RepID=A0ABS5I031_9GAMM|nr:MULTISPECIES: DUF3192 domain-containing protein [Shewanella]MBR9727380.1 DUF3192 domain-containing protein [Shewanella intestini]MRG35570.1 DUF3192 domain-containing protein [Shewanella sp. XMDDZSB0408]